MELINRTNLIVGIVIGLVVGLVLGLVFAWGIWPVEWTNARSYDLGPEAKAEYVGLVADSYRQHLDVSRAAAFFEGWTEEEMQQAFADAIDRYEAAARPEKVQAIQDLKLVLGVGEAPPISPEAGQGFWDRIRVPCLVFVVVLLVLVLGYVGYQQAIKRREAAERAGPAVGRAPAVPRAEEWEGVGQPPLGHFFTTYQLGEDTYDESFSVETPAGEFLGECGVGISETIGTGEPDRVTAFEVWLFDKTDIRTITKVLMSEHAYNDDTLRAKLASKGEAVLAQPGQSFSLETTGLHIRAEISEMVYGEGNVPPNSFFSKLTVELVATAKPAEGEASPF